jgi:hypothetical protein
MSLGHITATVPRFHFPLDLPDIFATVFFFFRHTFSPIIWPSWQKSTEWCACLLYCQMLLPRRRELQAFSVFVAGVLVGKWMCILLSASPLVDVFIDQGLPHVS